MTTGIPVAQSFFRGQTLRFRTTFYDFDGNISQPPSATLIVEYDSTTGEDQQLSISMFQVGTQWQALLDTRNFEAPRQVQWSIHTSGTAPNAVAVQDGTFMLAANQANQPTFP